MVAVDFTRENVDDLSKLYEEGKSSVAAISFLVF